MTDSAQVNPPASRVAFRNPDVIGPRSVVVSSAGTWPKNALIRPISARFSALPKTAPSASASTAGSPLLRSRTAGRLCRIREVSDRDILLSHLDGIWERTYARDLNRFNP